MSTLTSPAESIDERLDRLVSSRSDSWPPLHSTATAVAIGEIIRRVAGIEDAMHEIALELQKLAPEAEKNI